MRWLLFCACFLCCTSGFTVQHIHARKPVRTFRKAAKGTRLSSELSQVGSDDIENEPSNAEASKLQWDTIVKQSKMFWEMASPYYKESNSGRWLFAGMIGMTLINSAVSVAFSYLGKDFWNALSAKDPDQFYLMLAKFGVALVVGAPVVVIYRFQRERLSVSWREWMTDRTLQLYSSHRVYYSLERNSDIDNPDQRIAEDVRTFTTFSLELFITIVTSVIDLVSFSAILYSIQPQLFAAIVAYATFGTIVTTFLGRSLVGLNFLKLQKEADFRYTLVRLRENAESIAFYGGEDLEGKNIMERLAAVIGNKRDLIGAQRNLEFFTTAYRYLVQIVPVAVVAPQYFAGAVQLGVVSQSAGAFNHILSDLSVIVNEFEQLSSFSAGIDRLSQFYTEMREVDTERADSMPLLQLINATDVVVAEHDGEMISHKATNGGATSEAIQLTRMAPINGEPRTATPIVTISNLSLVTPDRKRTLIQGLNLDLLQGQNLLIVGESGMGKSSLLRSIAGLWTAGGGSITRPADEDVYFLPQRPYCALGSLKDQLLYPSLENDDDTEYPEGHVMSSAHLLRRSMTDDELLDVLAAVDLKELATRAGDGDPYKGLRAVKDWSNMLSLGEQQRLAFGRVLVNKPKLVILDEATSALDMVSEAKMYQLVQNMAGKTVNRGQMSGPGLTYISVGHRPSLLAHHDKRLRLRGEREHELSDIEKSAVNLTSRLSNL